jgi:DNA-directed RNA polymerase specialized sigma24 family protein
MFLKIKSKDRSEFKSFILDILLDNDEKLIKAYEGGWIDFFIWRIIANQYFSTTSPWYRKHLIKDYTMIDIPEIIEEDDSIQEDVIIQKVKDILRRTHWFNRKLFEMYYFDKMTYQEIQIKTGIGYTAVRRAVTKTLEDVKKQLNIK